YKIHVSLLTKLSTNMGEILAIPTGKAIGDPTQEGTERFPLHLPGLTVQEFEDFLFWVYRIEWKPVTDPAEKERILINLLKISSMWEMDKLLDLSDDDAMHMDIKVYSILAKGMQRMEIEMRRTANVEPTMTADPDWECKKHSLCVATWKRLWWDKVGRSLLHPDTPIKTDAILAEVRKLKHKDLNEQCRLDMVREIETNIVFVDRRVVAGVVAAIIAYHESL
ncbi:hypothetical protein B0H19DRAFT_957156, partial [Mycena capillaripes]